MLSSLLVSFGWLLAVNERLRAPARYLARNRFIEHLWFLWLVLLTVGTVWLVILYWNRYRSGVQQRLENQPEGLLEELCDAHRLDRNERQLLQEAAQQVCSDRLGMIFIDPSLLAKHAAQSAEAVGELSSLSKKLFGDEARA